MAEQRNLGIDLARIVAMVLVILFHFFDWGGVDAAKANSVSLHYARVLSWCCIDVFALISGYVAIGRTWHFSRWINLWMQVFVTGLVCGVVVCVLYGLRPSSLDISKVILPVVSREYWYFTDYTLLFFLMPFLRTEKLTNKDFALILGLGFVVFCVCKVARFGDTFNMHGGFSAVWLVYLYLLGAYLRRQTFKICRSTWALAFAIPLLGVLLLYLFPLAYRKLFCGYTAPMVVVESLLIVAILAHLKIDSIVARKIIAFFAPTTFGVYLWHCQPLVLAYIFKDRFVFLQDVPVLSGAAAFFCALGLFVSIALLEKVRIGVFGYVTDLKSTKVKV